MSTIFGTVGSFEPGRCDRGGVVHIYRAECWFLEAYYHFKVLQNYGPCPIIETR